MAIVYYPKQDKILQRDTISASYEQIVLSTYPNNIIYFGSSSQLTALSTSIFYITCSHAINVDTASYVQGFVQSASYAQTASVALTSLAGGTTLTTGSIYPITSSWADNASTASYITGSVSFDSSIIYQLTASNSITSNTASYISASNLPPFTASWSSFSTSASNAASAYVATTASSAAISDYTLSSNSSSYSITASYINGNNIDGVVFSASNSTTAVISTWATSASSAASAYVATTSSNSAVAYLATTASNAAISVFATSAGTANTASYISASNLPPHTASWASFAVSASSAASAYVATTASSAASAVYATMAGSASNSTNAIIAQWATSASSAASAYVATTASNAASASSAMYAYTASFASSASNAATAYVATTASFVNVALTSSYLSGIGASRVIGMTGSIIPDTDNTMAIGLDNKRISSLRVGTDIYVTRSFLDSNNTLWQQRNQIWPNEIWVNNIGNNYASSSYFDVYSNAYAGQAGMTLNLYGDINGTRYGWLNVMTNHDITWLALNADIGGAAAGTMVAFQPTVANDGTTPYKVDTCNTLTGNTKLYEFKQGGVLKSYISCSGEYIGTASSAASAYVATTASNAASASYAMYAYSASSAASAYVATTASNAQQSISSSYLNGVTNDNIINVGGNLNVLGNITPSSSSTWNIGNTSSKWNSIHANDAVFYNTSIITGSASDGFNTWNYRNTSRPDRLFIDQIVNANSESYFAAQNNGFGTMRIDMQGWQNPYYTEFMVDTGHTYASLLLMADIGGTNAGTMVQFYPTTIDDGTIPYIFDTCYSLSGKLFTFKNAGVIKSYVSGSGEYVGTASYANNAITASYITASNINGFIAFATSASNAASASAAKYAYTASFASSASNASLAYLATTASNARVATYASSSTSASYLIAASDPIPNAGDITCDGRLYVTGSRTDGFGTVWQNNAQLFNNELWLYGNSGAGATSQSYFDVFQYNYTSINGMHMELFARADNSNYTQLFCNAWDNHFHFGVYADISASYGGEVVRFRPTVANDGTSPYLVDTNRSLTGNTKLYEFRQGGVLKAYISASGKYVGTASVADVATTASNAASASSAFYSYTASFASSASSAASSYIASTASFANSALTSSHLNGIGASNVIGITGSIIPDTDNTMTLGVDNKRFSTLRVGTNIYVTSSLTDPNNTVWQNNNQVWPNELWVKGTTAGDVSSSYFDVYSNNYNGIAGMTMNLYGSAGARYSQLNSIISDTTCFIALYSDIAGAISTGTMTLFYPSVANDGTTPYMFNTSQVLTGNTKLFELQNGGVIKAYISASGLYVGTASYANNATTASNAANATFAANSNALSGLGSTAFTFNAMTVSQSSVNSADTRNDNYLPWQRDRGLYVDFKSNTTDGLSDGGTYHGNLTFRPYGSTSDLTGGPPHQLGFTENGNLYIRTGQGGNNVWNPWYKIVREGTGSVYNITASYASNVSETGVFTGKSNNYVPRWSSNTLTATSTIYDTSNYVGISTTNPTEKLYINGGGWITDGYLAANGELFGGWKSIVGGWARGMGWIGSGSNQILGMIGALGTSEALSYMYFGSGSNVYNSPWMVITNGGNVGIGTTSPSGKLHIYDSTSNSLRIQSTGVEASMNIYNTTQNYQVGCSTGIGGYWIYESNASAYRLVVLSGSGNVGIGTSSPSYILDVNGQTLGLGTKTISAGNGGTIYHRDDSGNPKWATGLLGVSGSKHYSLYDLSNTRYALFVDGTSGYVAVGNTNAPTSMLDVYGTASFRGHRTLHPLNSVVTHYPQDAAYTFNGTVTGSIVIQLPQSASATMCTFKIRVFNYNGTTACNINCAGYVYSADGNWYNTSAVIEGQVPIVDKVIFAKNTANGYPCIILNGPNTGSTSYDYVHVIVESVTTGLSNTTANWETGWQVSAKGDISSYTTLATHTSITTHIGTAGPNNYVPKWSSNKLSTTSLIYDNGSYVGINTTSPEAMLQVNGAGRFMGAFSGGTGTGVEIEYQDGIAYLTCYDRTNNIWKPLSVRASGITLQNNGNPIMTITSSNVGIGTTNPLAKLQVNGSNTSDGVVASLYGTGAGGSFLHFTDNTLGNWAAGMTPGNTGFGVYYNRYPGGLGTQVMSMLYTGQVGIGTTSPQATLHVQGNISCSNVLGNIATASNGLFAGGTWFLNNGVSAKSQYNCSFTLISSGYYGCKFTNPAPNPFYVVSIDACTHSIASVNPPSASIGCAFNKQTTSFTMSFVNTTALTTPADPATASVSVFSF